MTTEAVLTDMIRKASLKFEQRAKEDLLAALQSFNDLVPSVKVHDFPDGQKRQTLALTGTIPVNYKAHFSCFFILFFRVTLITYRLRYIAWTIILTRVLIATFVQRPT